jgi:hypothetical protein
MRRSERDAHADLAPPLLHDGGAGVELAECLNEE